MIVHDSRNSAFRRPFGAAETGTEVYLAAEKAGAADMTLRLHPFTGEDTLLPMASEGGGRVPAAARGLCAAGQASAVRRDSAHDRHARKEARP